MNKCIFLLAVESSSVGSVLRMEFSDWRHHAAGGAGGADELLHADGRVARQGGAATFAVGANDVLHDILFLQYRFEALVIESALYYQGFGSSERALCSQFSKKEGLDVLHVPGDSIANYLKIHHCTLLSYNYHIYFWNF